MTDRTNGATALELKVVRKAWRDPMLHEFDVDKVTANALPPIDDGFVLS